MSLSVKRRGSRLSICKIPNGALPSPRRMATLATALTPLSIRKGGYSNRVSWAMSEEIIGSPVFRAWASDVRSDILVVTSPTTPGFQPTPARTNRVLAVLLQLHDLGQLGAERVPYEAAGLGQDLVQVVGFEGEFAEPGECGLLSKQLVVAFLHFSQEAPLP